MLWLGVMDMTGSAFTSPVDTVAEKVAQVLLTFDGLAFLPVLTAVVVGARLTGSLRRKERPLIDHEATARGVAFARNLGLPVVIGDAPSERVLRQAVMARLYVDSIGFAAAKMIRRILGLAHVIDLEKIADPERRALCETRALRLARELMVNRRRFDSIAAVADAAQTVRHEIKKL